MNHLSSTKSLLLKKKLIPLSITYVKSAKLNFNLMSSGGGSTLFAILILLLLPVVIWVFWGLFAFFISEVVYFFCRDVEAADLIGKILSGVLLAGGTVFLIISMVRD